MSPVIECVLFEEFEASLNPSKIVNMFTVGIGEGKEFSNADTTIYGLKTLPKFNICLGFEIDLLKNKEEMRLEEI